jgi:hypothetical protein
MFRAHGESKVKRGVVVFLILEALVVVQVILADRDSFLTVSEMCRRGIVQGLPFVWHFGMWGDVLVVSPLVATVVARYSQGWTPFSIFAATATGCLAAIGMASVYSLSDMPQAHVLYHHTTPAGYVHILYMGLALTVFILMYFNTAQISHSFLLWANVLILIHLLYGTHMVLGATAFFVELPWYNDRPLRSPLGWLTILLLSGGLCWRTLHILRRGRP